MAKCLADVFADYMQQ